MDRATAEDGLRVPAVLTIGGANGFEEGEICTYMEKKVDNVV